MAVFLFGLLSSMLASGAVYLDREAAAHAEFLRLTERVVTEIERRFTASVHGLKGARGVYATGLPIGPAAFRAYVASRDLSSEYPGILGFGFIERVARGDVERFVLAGRQEGARDFDVQSRGAASSTYLVKYMEPSGANTTSRGVDLGAEELRRTEIEGAIASGRPTLTAPMDLLRGPRPTPGYLLMLPVYLPGASEDSDNNRSQQLAGVLFAPLATEQLLVDLPTIVFQRLGIELFDGPVTEPNRRVYNANRNAVEPDAPVHAPSVRTHASALQPRFSNTKHVLLGERVFTVRTTTQSSFDAVHSQGTAAVVGFSGVLLSLLLTWIAWLHATVRDRIDARLWALTAERKGLARVAERTTNAVIITDEHGCISWVNEGFSRTTGYSLQDVLRRPVRDFLCSGITDPSQTQRLEAALLDHTPVAVELAYRTRNGSVHWAQVDVQPSFDALGTIRGSIYVGTDITARKRAEKLLQDARDEAASLAARLEVMALVARNTTNAVFVTDADFRIRWANDAFVRTSGYTLDEALGRFPRELVGPGGANAGSGEALREAVKQGQSFNGEFMLRSKAGRTYWVEVHVSPMLAVDGSISGYISIESDISDRRATAAELAQERNWLAQVVAGAGAGEAEFNAITREIRWSKRFAAILGYTVEEVTSIAPSWGSCLHHPDDVLAAVDATRAYVKGTTHHLVAEYRLRHRDGHWVWIQTRASAASWAPDGRVEWLSGMNIDVTERHRNIDQLHESLALVDALFEATPVPMVLRDTELRFLRVNKAWGQMTGKAPESLLGKTMDDTLSLDEIRRLRQEDLALLARGGSMTREVQHEMGDGSQKHSLVSKAVVAGASGQPIGIVICAVDITSRLATERAIDEARAAAELANRAKSAFLAAMSHEIRTPMNGVMGMAELLTHSPLNDEQTQTVSTIISSGQSLLRLIDDILDFSKIEAGRMELDATEFAVAPLFESVCASLLPLAVGRDVRMSVWVDEGVPSCVVGDELRVRQLLNNLVGNAIKFSARSEGPPGRVAVRVHAEGGNVRFEVTDNGIGMDEAAITRLFSPFMQAEVSTTRRYGGTGLGLAICRRLVDLMDGRLDVQSELGIGSTFSCSLPLQECTVHSSADVLRLAGLRCVIVTEPALPVQQLHQWMERAGAVVQQADSLSAAIQQAAVHKYECDATIIVHTNASAALALPVGPDTGVRQLVVGYGRRETARIITPAVCSIDLLRREPFVNAVAMVAGRVAPQPSASLQATALNSGQTTPTIEHARMTGQLILVAEDDATNRSVLQRQLAVLGHVAEFAHDGDQALVLWRTGHYVLLLTDLHMPAMDGYALSTMIRLEETTSGRPRMPIVALTANALKGEAARALDTGMDEYITKPVPLAQLRATLAAWMPQSRPASVPAAAPPLLHDTGDVLDVQVLRGLIGGSDEIVRELLSDFIISAQQHADELRMSLRASDAQAVSAVAHKLKSASRSVGAMPLSEACAVLEAAGLEGESALTPDLVARFEVALRAVMNSTHSLLETTPT